MILEAFEADELDLLYAAAARFFLSLSADHQAIDDVLQHGLVGQQRKPLEDHGHLAASKCAKRIPIHAEHVHAIHLDTAGGRLDEPIEVADEGRLAGARQTHDDEGLAGLDVEGHVANADDMPGTFKELGLADAAAHLLKHGLRFGAEDLVDVLYPDLDVLGGHGIRPRLDDVAASVGRRPGRCDRR